jgi:signal transduction histidine kinase
MDQSNLEYLITAVIILSIIVSAVIFMLVAYNRRVLQHKRVLQFKEKEKQSALLDAAIDSQEQERQRIGANIHDDIGPLLSTLKLYINKLLYTRDDDDLKNQIGGLNEQIDDIIQTIRTVSRNLVPSVLLEFGLAVALEDLMAKFRQSGSISTTFNSTGDDIQLPTKVELSLYRMIQELCNNVLRHADASSLDIHISNNGKLVINIDDDGRGIPTDILENNKAGLGLKNISARANSIGAIFNIQPRDDGGTRATIEYSN